MLNFIQAIDIRIFRLVFAAYRHSGLEVFARCISITADGWLYFLLIPMILLTRPAEAGSVLMAITGGFCLERSLYFLMKNAFRRQRPPAILDGVQSLVMAGDEFSFPSGHTSAAFFIATLLVVMFGMQCLPLYAWAAAVGASRVVLGVHFPTDIVAGAMIGTTLALTIPL